MQVTRQDSIVSDVDQWDDDTVLDIYNQNGCFVKEGKRGVEEIM